MPTIEEIKEHRVIVVLNGDHAGETLYVTNYSDSGDFLDCCDSNGTRITPTILRSNVRLADFAERLAFSNL